MLCNQDIANLYNIDMAKIDYKKIFDSVKDFAKTLVRKYFIFLLHLTPHQNIAQTILAYTILGTIVLSLPFMNTTHVAFIDNFVTAAAAVSTSGINSVSFADSYTFLGKLVVLILIQIGGIGYMTFASFVYRSLAQKNKLRKIQDKITTEVSLPNTLQISDFLWAALIFTILAEAIGTGFLFNYFRHHDYSVGSALWYSIFHSVSAFCTAGFSLWNNSLENFTDSKTMNLVIACLSLAGAIGFIVVSDVFNFIRRKTKEISFTTKIIVISMTCLVTFGTLTLFITSPGISFAEAFFQSTSAITTAGFNTVDVKLLSSCSILILILLMSVGGAPSGTAGGFKTTVFCSVLALVYSRLKQNPRVEFLGHRIPVQRLYAATSTLVLYIIFLFISVFLLTWTERDIPFLNLVFESTAALSTGGIVTGSTGQLSVLGKLILIATMIIGRIGVVTFSMALISQNDEDEPREKVTTEDVAV